MNIIIPLDSIELDIIKYLFDSDIETGYITPRQTGGILTFCSSRGYEETKSREALLCLVDRDLLNGQAILNRSGFPTLVSLTQSAFDEEIERRFLNYDQIKEKVANYLASLKEEQIAKQDGTQLSKIANSLNEPLFVINHMVGFFRKLGWVRLYREGSEYAIVSYVSPLLRRAIDSQ